MQQTQAQIGENLATQALVFDGSSFDGKCLGFLDHGADDKSLATLCNLVGDEGICFGAAIACTPAADDLQATGGHLVNDRDIQVAIQGECQGAWNRRGRHDQHVGMVAFLAQGIALLYAKAVLFINDNQPKSLKTHIFLDEGMCANGDHRLSTFQSGTISGTFTGAHTAS